MRCLLAVLCSFSFAALSPSVFTQQTAAPPKPLPEVADQLKKGDGFLHANQYEQALKTYQEGLDKAIQLKDVDGQGQAWQDIGIAYYYLNDLAKALDGFQKSEALFEAAGDLEMTAGSLMDIGVVNDNLGHPDVAIEYYQKALPLDRKLGDPDQIARVLLNIGLLLYGEDRWVESLQYDDEARQEFIKAKDKRWELESMITTGRCYFYTGKVDEAAKLFREVIGQSTTPALQITKATGLANLSNTAWDKPLEQLDELQQSLAISQQIHSARGTGDALAMIGAVYERMGQPRLAADALNQSLEIAGKGGFRAKEAEVLHQLGQLAERNKDDVTAEQMESKALALNRGMHNQHRIASCLTALGQIDAATQHWAKAHEELNEALQIDRAEKDSSDEAETLDALGLTYLGEHEQDLAIATLREAVRVGKSPDTTGALGKAYRQAGRLQEAEASYRVCIGMVESARSGLGGFSDAKVGYLDAKMDAYRDLITLLIEQYKPVEAFEFVQKTKGRVLLDLLSEGRVSIEQDLTPAERQEERALRAQSEALNAAIVSEGAKNEVGGKKRSEALKLKLREADTKLAEFTDKLYTRHPELAHKRSASTLGLAEIGASLPPDTALLEYFVAGDATSVFVVSSERGRGAVKAYSVPFKPGQLAKECVAFHEACSNPSKEYRALSRSLYDRLVAPALPQLKGKARLLVCPDGPLWDVPFCALSSAKGFLSDRFELDYAFSGTAHVVTSRHKPSSAPNSMLVMANPNLGGKARFGDNPLIPGQRPIEPASRPIEPASRPIEPASRPIEPASRDLSQQLSRGGAAELPGTQLEADAIGRIYPDATILTRDKAQESTFKKLAGGYRNLHIASHAFFNDASPMLSSIVLAKPTDSSEDGYLTAREIFEMKLNADLVVLSACNTARGEQTSGEGVIGMSWALFAAGVPAQVISQWSVDDQATAQLMSRFYADKKHGENSGAALRHAESGLRRADLKWRHPYYWAPFVLLGDWR